jgi:hypothetical protein
VEVACSSQVPSIVKKKLKIPTYFYPGAFPSAGCFRGR